MKHRLEGRRFFPRRCGRCRARSWNKLTMSFTSSGFKCLKPRRGARFTVQRLRTNGYGPYIFMVPLRDVVNLKSWGTLKRGAPMPYAAVQLPIPSAAEPSNRTIDVFLIPFAAETSESFIGRFLFFGWISVFKFVFSISKMKVSVQSDCASLTVLFAI